uniref:Uncharacterized protein n=1 Tax=Caenorhabditis japonica TaxID=281687 RepID=A0A8R1ELY0_CAEJA
MIRVTTGLPKKIEIAPRNEPMQKLIPHMRPEHTSISQNVDIQEPKKGLTEKKQINPSAPAVIPCILRFLRP